MARAAVKAKAKQGKAGAQPSKTSARRQTGRRGHASGGNPNQDLFFTKLRKRAKWVYVLLAVLFALTFAFLGVGSGQGGGLDQLLNGLNIFHSSGNPVSKAQKHIKDHPQDPQGFRELATAYESKGDNGNAISALQQYTSLKPKDAKSLTELAGLQMNQASDYLKQYQAAYQNRQLLTPSQSFLPTGKLGQALGTSQVEQVQAQRADAAVQDLQQRTQLAYNGAVSSYESVTKLTPNDSNAWFSLAQAAQQAGNYTSAVTAYKRYLKLNPASTSRSQIEALIKQLSPAPAPPSKKKK
jgi:cytochrome c-type biogenesis protein CcmH/NrfG